MDVSIVVSLLPLFFLLHELEEIIMVRSWLDKNQAALRERFFKSGTYYCVDGTNDHQKVYSCCC